ncbi:hypothetical protein N665_0345s0004 [Sinapis alba]|nr:hypothetical protein N665_0345s0004 [Sinapis alba]
MCNNKEPFYKCNLSNDECTFTTMPMEERYIMDDDSSIISLLVNKDDDVSSMCSSTESLAAYDADLENFISNESEANYIIRSRCTICIDAHRDFFFLPCGHCISCYQCRTN